MRPAALSLSRALAKAREMVRDGIIETERIEQEAREILSAFPDITIDYISICDPLTLDSVRHVKGKTLMALAVNLRKIRLIDNTVLEPES